jgi:hypothetical protein
MFVKRDSLGRIITISVSASEECSEQVDAADPCLIDFIQQNQAFALQHYELKDSDLPLVRVLEDLIDLLSETGVIRFTDLPAEAQNKLLKRKSMRRGTGRLNLLDHDDDMI